MMKLKKLVNYKMLYPVLAVPTSAGVPLLGSGVERFEGFNLQTPQLRDSAGWRLCSLETL